jgi:hypothetical protein
MSVRLHMHWRGKSPDFVLSREGYLGALSGQRQYSAAEHSGDRRQLGTGLTSKQRALPEIGSVFERP